jgi:hypothetical protein
MVSFTPQPLYSQGKSPYYQLDWTLVGPQSRRERCGNKKKNLYLPGIELQLLGCPVCFILSMLLPNMLSSG